jgi:hypothetical protein
MPVVAVHFHSFVKPTFYRKIYLRVSRFKPVESPDELTSEHHHLCGRHAHGSIEAMIDAV